MQVSVSLDKRHIRMVKDYGKRMGIGAFSVALQSMITRFEKLEAENLQQVTYTPPEVEIPKDVAALLAA